MTLGIAPFTSISRAHNSGMSEMPIERAPAAGNSEVMSGVAVKMMLTKFCFDTSFLSIMTWRSSAVAEITSPALSSGIEVAPLSALSSCMSAGPQGEVFLSRDVAERPSLKEPTGRRCRS